MYPMNAFMLEARKSAIKNSPIGASFVNLLKMLDFFTFNELPAELGGDVFLHSLKYLSIPFHSAPLFAILSHSK